MVSCFHESKLPIASPYTDFPNCFSLRWNRPDGRGGGGLPTLIHHNITFSNLNTGQLFPGDSTLKLQSLTFLADDAKLKIININIPLFSNCSIDYRPTLQHFLASHDEDTLIVRDFNAHNSAWCSIFENRKWPYEIKRGITSNNLINDCNLTFLNENNPAKVSLDGASFSTDLNFFASNYLQNVQIHSSYTDDVHAVLWSKNHKNATDAVIVLVESVRDWAEERGLQISAPKSHVKLFTSDIRQSHLHSSVTLYSSPLPLERHPQFFGVTFDTLFSSS